jgi:hypothetical protein
MERQKHVTAFNFEMHHKDHRYDDVVRSVEEGGGQTSTGILSRYRIFCDKDALLPVTNANYFSLSVRY